MIAPSMASAGLGSSLPLPAPAEQTQRAEAGGEDIYKNL
jgi:hypothetical protein